MSRFCIPAQREGNFKLNSASLFHPFANGNARCMTLESSSIVIMWLRQESWRL